MSIIRFFNKRQKQLLYTEAKGLCMVCGIQLDKGWHADHVVPYSKNGMTELENGQALCPKCNQKKYNKMNNYKQLELRKWQKEFISLPIKSYDTGGKCFLLHAGVGSGKTIAAVCAAKYFIDRGFNVLIISPSTNVKNKWSIEFNNYSFNIFQDYKFNYNYKIKKYIHGISTTFQTISYRTPENEISYNLNFLLENNIVDNKTLLILDEVHHLGENQAWGGDIQKLGEKCGYVISLTGTPYRSDDNKIPFASYESIIESDSYKLKVDYSYSYGNSVKDKVCCPISFRSFDVHAYGCQGMLMKNVLHTKIFNSALIIESGFVYEMYKKADELLNELREIKPDAAGLIVCNNQKEARELHEKIPNSVLVISDENNGSEIEEFIKSNAKWIISVQMISEGVDIPRLRVLVYAINITTPLFFTQVAGRIVRNRNDDDLGTIDHGFFFYPNYEPLVNNAKQIETEIAHIVKEQEDEFEEKLEKEIRELGDDSDNPIYDVSTGDINYINAGIEVNEIAEFRHKLLIADYLKLERLFALSKKENVINQTDNIPLSTRIKKLRKKISITVNRISKESGMEYSHIHHNLNKICGLNNDIEKDTNIDALSMKLNQAERLLKTIINNG